MSREIPNSYSEYLYTPSSDMIVDGGIMPLRNDPEITSTWNRNCLRGEDPIFLAEAVNIRGKCTGFSFGVPVPTPDIAASKL